MKRLLFLLLAVCSGCGSGGAQDVKAGATAYVKVAVLNARLRPSATAMKTTAFRLADKVYVVARGKRVEQIGEYRGRWFKVRKGTRQGWVYGPFLSAKPVMTGAQVRKLIQGVFYYHDVNNYNHIKRMLYITGQRYREKIYKSGVGLVEVFYGKIEFQADSIELFPFRRKLKTNSPSVDTGSAYTAPSYSDENFTVTTDYASLKRGRVKYFLFYVDGKLYLTRERPKKTNRLRRDQFKKVTWVYIRKH